MKKVSVIIPVYNSEEHLELCLNSLINQSYKNIEIILINDGSTDNSKKIIQTYQQQDSRIILINQKNQGVAKTRNKGLSKASGYYCMFMDNDDKIDENYIEEFIKIAEAEKLDIVIGGYVRETYSGKILFRRKAKNDEIAPYILISPWGKLYRTNFIKNFNFLESSVADEFYFNVMAYNNTKKIKAINNIGYHWMFNNKSLSNTSNKALNQTDELLLVLTKIYNDLEDKITSEFEYFCIRTLIYYILFACKNVSIDKIMENYQKMNNWLIERFPNYSKNKYIKILNNSSESLKIRIIIKIFIFISKIHCTKPFLYVYSKL